MTSQEFLDIVKEGHVPSSSQPSIGETMELFENIQRKTFWLLIWLMDYQEHTKVQ